LIVKTAARSAKLVIVLDPAPDMPTKPAPPLEQALKRQTIAYSTVKYCMEKQLASNMQPDKGIWRFPASRACDCN
jgi:hypothetical protein